MPSHSEPAPEPGPAQQLAAWGVHAYTALGLPVAFASTFALFHHDAKLFFALNCVAVLIDATDGMLARRLRVREVLPQFDGRRLDDIVDFITFALLPCIAMSELGLLPEGLGWLAVVPLVASGYGFCQDRAKTDESFVGFPSYWNVGALYFYLLGSSPWTNLAVMLVFSALVFVPIHYVYPTKTRMLRRTTISLGFLWAALMFTLALNPHAPWAYGLAWLSCLYPAYYLVLSGVNHLRLTRRLDPGGAA